MENTTGFNRPRRFVFNMLVYVITIAVVLTFIYFIYQFLYGSKAAQTNLIISDILDAKSSDSAVSDVKIPPIYDGGACSINFWMYINDFNGYKSGTRKHLVEIGGSNFSTIVIALGATTPSLLVRVHTMGSDDIANLEGHNYGITDCSGGDANCASGNMSGFSKITDVNLTVHMKDNALTPDIITTFFQPFTHLDENTLLQSNSTCDIKDIDLQKWVNVCVIMSGKTVDIYLQGKLVKSCIYNSYFKVDKTGVTLKALQGTYDSTGAAIPNTAGFGGNFGRLQVFNTELTPDDIYKNYLAGPKGASSTNDPLGFIKYIFTGTS